MAKLPLAPFAVVKLVRELRTSSAHRRPIVLAGARLLVDALRRELVREGEAWAVREGSAAGAAALVYVLAEPPTEEDEVVLREANRENVPIFVLGPDPRTPIPYVLATDVIPLPPGEGFPLDELGRLLAAKLDEEATALATALPALRRPVADALVAKVARQNGIIAAAVFVPGIDFPILTLNQLRLVLRLAAAYGHELDAQRLPEILGVVGAALGFREVARQALGVIPFAGWAIQGGVAYTGTRALGEAAIRYFEARSGGSRSETGAASADRA